MRDLADACARGAVSTARSERVGYGPRGGLARGRGALGTGEHDPNVNVTEVVSEVPLAGRVALVTGAGFGVGRACAIALARAGCHVATCDSPSHSTKETAEACRRESGRAQWFAASVDDPDDVERLWVEVTAALGAPVILVNGAGASLAKPLGSATPGEWSEMVRGNLDAAFYCSRAVLPAMRAAGFGRIVNVAPSPASAAM